MSTILKEISSVTYRETIDKGNLDIVSGDNLNFILSNITGNTYSHLWMGPIFSVPCTDTMKEPFTVSYLNGGYSGTSLEYLVTDVEDNIIIADISRGSFDTGIDGLNFKLTIPLDSTYTGSTTLSGLSTTTLYGSYMKTYLYDQKATNGPCALSVLDGLYSEESSVVTREINEGLPYNEGVNPEPNGYYNSGLVYLFCDDIKKPNVSATTVTTTNSWSTGFGNEGPYTLYKKFPFNYMTNELEGLYMDQPVGAVDLLGGNVTIFNKDLVNAFDFSVATGGTSTSGATFSSTDANVTFKSLSLSQKLDITLIAGKNEFVTSSNPTWDPTTCNGKIYITHFELYDESGQVVAVGEAKEPILKESSDLIVIETSIGI